MKKLHIIVVCVSFIIVCLCGCKSFDREDSKSIVGNENRSALVDTKLEKRQVCDVVLEWKDYSVSRKNVSVVSFPSYEDRAHSLRWCATESFTVQTLSQTNWLQYDRIKFAIYSEKKTDTYVQLRFNNGRTSNDTPMAPYFSYKIKVDFSGWKSFEIPFAVMGTGYNPQWGNIVSVSFDCNGWGLKPNEENILYFDNFYLCKTDYVLQSENDLNEIDVCQMLLTKWRTTLVGERDVVPKIPEYESRVKKISSDCSNAWISFKSTYNNHKDSAWGLEIPYGVKGGEAKISTLYENILAMTTGYATLGSDFYRNEDLLKDIKVALEYGYIHYYGKEVLDKGIYGNWWFWDIGIPKKLVNILIILEHALTPESISRYLSLFDFLNPYPSMTACNRVDIAYSVLASACLQGDLERMIIARDLTEEVFYYVVKGDGFYEDGSFIQHDNFPYTGGYGLDMLREVTNLCYILGGTVLEFQGEAADNQYKWIFDSFRPVMYEGNFFSAVRGRSVHRNNSEAAFQKGAVASMIKMQDYAPSEIKEKLEPLIKHYMVTTGRNYAENVPLPLVAYSVNLYNDKSIKLAQNYNIVKVFGNMDRIVQHGAKYGVSLSFSSDRIYKYEAINNENRNGWYQGDGMIHLYTDGYDYSYAFYHHVNPYLLPGTTVTSQEREIKNLSKNIFNGSPFAGGVEFGSYGIGAFELGYAKGNGVFESNIAARKSYFMFDDEIVAVGSGINDDSSTMVRTVVENRLWRDEDVFAVSGKNVSASTQEEDTDAKYMHFTNMGGYVFLNGTTTKYKKAENTNSFLEIVIEHGKNPTDECYSYVYLPEATARQTKKYSAKPDVEIIAQSESVHIVQEKTLGITGYVFYESGSAYGITVDNPCVIMIGKKKGKTTVSISEPTQHEESLTVRLELDRVKKIVDCDQKMEGIVSDGVVSFSVDTAGSCGRTFTATLK